MRNASEQPQLPLAFDRQLEQDAKLIKEILQKS